MNNTTIDIHEDGTVLYLKWGRTAKDGAQELVERQTFDSWDNLLIWLNSENNEARLAHTEK